MWPGVVGSQSLSGGVSGHMKLGTSDLLPLRFTSSTSHGCSRGPELQQWVLNIDGRVGIIVETAACPLHQSSAVL